MKEENNEATNRASQNNRRVGATKEKANERREAETQVKEEEEETYLLTKLLSCPSRAA